MERILVVIRHAKSSWSNPLQSDFDRPLNQRGIADAPIMGESLKQKGLIPDLVISSTARRAAETSKGIAGAIGYATENILWKDRMYHCVDTVFTEVLEGVSDEVKTVFMVAHNPGITDFANSLSSKFRIDNMPTCSVVACRVDIEEWSAFENCTKEVFLFDYPKNHT